MIGQLGGDIVDARETHRGCEVVIDVAGVGYRALVKPADLEKLSSARGTQRIFTHLHVREDDLSLFGFTNVEERDLFEVLLGASGVGPKVALAILDVHSPRSLKKAVAAGDSAALTMVSGIGPKTAQKLLLELRDRLGTPALESVPASGSAPIADVTAALTGLGYSSQEIRDALDELDADSDPEVMLRDALRRLGRKAKEA